MILRAFGCSTFIVYPKIQFLSIGHSSNGGFNISIVSIAMLPGLRGFQPRFPKVFGYALTRYNISSYSACRFLKYSYAKPYQSNRRYHHTPSIASFSTSQAKSGTKAPPLRTAVFCHRPGEYAFLCVEPVPGHSVDIRRLCISVPVLLSRGMSRHFRPAR